MSLFISSVSSILLIKSEISLYMKAMIWYVAEESYQRILKIYLYDIGLTCYRSSWYVKFMILGQNMELRCFYFINGEFP